jgi:hypothetical protein
MRTLHGQADVAKESEKKLMDAVLSRARQVQAALK